MSNKNKKIKREINTKRIVASVLLVAMVLYFITMCIAYF